MVDERWRRRWISVGTLLLTVGLLAVSEASAQPGDQAAPDTAAERAAALWADFNHFVRIARPDQADAAGRTLLSITEDDRQTLLDVVEASTYADYARTIERATKLEVVQETAQRLGRRIQSARVDRARDPQRIRADLARLAEGARANLNALERLRAAGQYAAPVILETLEDETQVDLHPYVLAATVSLGQPLVYPLASALDRLPAVNQMQLVYVIAEIGYPRALPYLQALVENPRTDASVREEAARAVASLSASSRLPDNVSAAELFLTLGQNYYDTATDNLELLPGLDASDEVGVIWTYTRRAGLVPLAIPQSVFGDVLTMEAARRALDLNPNSDQALSLWLMANLRRENRLGPDETDLSYGPEMLPPDFYVEMAGPLRQHDILSRALDDQDPVLALDAIRALVHTGGTDALLNREGVVQPLIRALTYPDRRVRFEAAFALTNTRPKTGFEGSHRVVPVLGEAVRQSDTRYALVIGPDVEFTASLIRELGYVVFAGPSLAQVSGFPGDGPGVDLIVTNLDVNSVERLHRTRVLDYKLSIVPLIALTASTLEFNQRFEPQDRVFGMVASDNPADLRRAIEAIVRENAGDPMDADEATGYAMEAVRLLGELAKGQSPIYNVLDAQGILIDALRDDREMVALAVADVLAMLPVPEGQREIAELALDISLNEDARISLLNSLAQSAQAIGNELREDQLRKLLELVQTSTGELAIAAARVHGALTLPTRNVVDMLTSESEL